MDHMKILKRAWHIVRSYRALWVFGIILALTTASAGSGLNGGGGGGSDNADAPMFENFDGFKVDRDLQNWVDNFDPSEVEQAVITIAIVLVCVVLVLAVISTIARFVAEAALIKMVDDYEQTSEPLSVRQGFRLGWSREAWRMFLADLVISLPIFLLVFVPALGFVALIISMGTNGSRVIPVIIAGVLGLLLFILIGVVVGIVATVLKHFVWRQIAIEDQTVGAALRSGWAIMRAHLKDVGLMWLIMVGVNIAWNIAMLPVALIVIIVGGIVGLLAFLLTAGISSIFVGADTNWIIGAVIGVLFFIPVIAIPITIVEGFFKVYVSSAWTLAYRELDALNGVEPEPAPALEPAV